MAKGDTFWEADEIDFGPLLAREVGDVVPSDLLDLTARHLHLATPTSSWIGAKGMRFQTGPLIPSTDMLVAYGATREKGEHFCCVGSVKRPCVAAAYKKLEEAREFGIEHPVQVCDLIANALIREDPDLLVFEQLLLIYLPAWLQLKMPEKAKAINYAAEVGVASCICILRHGTTVITVLIPAGSLLPDDVIGRDR